LHPARAFEFENWVRLRSNGVLTLPTEVTQLDVLAHTIPTATTVRLRYRVGFDPSLEAGLFLIWIGEVKFRNNVS
jgi:hypothetical protein